MAPRPIAVTWYVHRSPVIPCHRHHLLLLLLLVVVVVVVLLLLIVLLLVVLLLVVPSDPSSARIFSLLLPNVNEVFMSFLYTWARGSGFRGGGGVSGFRGGGGGGHESVHVHVNFIVSALVSLARCLFPGILAFRFDNVVSWGRAYVLCGRVVCVCDLIALGCMVPHTVLLSSPPPCFPCFRCSVFCCVF